ncbi:MAG: biotin/lipoate A/B protein ligase family protein [Gemmatimonadaceae bacterium]
MSGIDNMALDEALMERARRSEEGVVRVYSWSAPTLSFGRNQIALGTYDASLANARNISVVRRPTGGRALLHYREITYSVTAATVPGESLRHSYDMINAALVDALKLMGIAASVATTRVRAPRPGVAPCFEEPTRGELTLEGRKLAGSAQIRDRGAYLQHGSILIDDDQGMLADVAIVDIGKIPKAATLREAVGETSPAIFADALFDVVRRRWDADASPLARDDIVYARMTELRAHYADDSWTWRR